MRTATKNASVGGNPQSEGRVFQRHFSRQRKPGRGVSGIIFYSQREGGGVVVLKQITAMELTIDKWVANLADIPEGQLHTESDLQEFRFRVHGDLLGGRTAEQDSQSSRSKLLDVRANRAFARAKLSRGSAGPGERNMPACSDRPL